MTKIDWQDIPDHPTWMNPNPTRDELETLIASIPKTITIPPETRNMATRQNRSFKTKNRSTDKSFGTKTCRIKSTKNNR